MRHFCLLAATFQLAVFLYGGSALFAQAAPDVYVVDGKSTGPVVIIVGGMHGNEPAGARAAEQIRHWPISRGRLVVIPRANERALQKHTRYTPDAPEDLRNLNRNFPRTTTDTARGALASALWAQVRRQRPAWVLDLHEGYGFSQSSKSVGNSIIFSRAPDAREQAERLLEAVNRTIEKEERRFSLKGRPIDGSLARAAARGQGARAMILETTFSEQPLSLRVRQHRLMVACLLAELGMYDGPADQMVAPKRPAGELRVALYDAGGCGARGPVAFEEALAWRRGVNLKRIGPPEIQGGFLEQFDVVIFPGGTGRGQATALGETGRAAVRRFVEGGGGYFGSCAGGYLAASNYDWSLKILDAQVIDREHWNRGRGEVAVELTPEGRRLLGGEGQPLEILYASGPLYAPGHRADIPDFIALAHFRGEINKVGAPVGVMRGTPALVAGRFGEGRVFCSSPHPEYADGLQEIVHRAVRWTARRPAPSGE